MLSKRNKLWIVEEKRNEKKIKKKCSRSVIVKTMQKT